MKHMKIMLAFTAFVISLMLPWSTRAQGEKVERSALWINSLNSKSPEAQKASVAEAVMERAAGVQTLRQVLVLPNIPQHRPQLAAAIQIAGILRVSEVVENLLDKIDFDEMGVHPTTKPVVLDIDYITVAALIAIGQPSVSPAIQRLRTEDDEFRQVLYIVVVQKVLGQRLAEAAVLDAIERDKAKGRNVVHLQEALKFLIERMRGTDERE